MHFVPATMGPSPGAKSLREAYCDRFGVDPDSFEDRFLRRCLYPHARPVAWLRRCLGRRPFSPDIDWIRAVAECRDLDSVRHELNAALSYDPIPGLWRRLLRIRVSGQRVMNLAALLLG